MAVTLCLNSVLVNYKAKSVPVKGTLGVERHDRGTSKR